MRFFKPNSDFFDCTPKAQSPKPRNLASCYAGARGILRCVVAATPGPRPVLVSVGGWPLRAYNRYKLKTVSLLKRQFNGHITSETATRKLKAATEMKPPPEFRSG